MSKKNIIAGLALLISGSTMAQVSLEKTIQIYNKLINKNNLVKATLYLSETDEINGWCNEKGIYITTGDLQVMSEAEMAGLLAHELAHYQFHDPEHYMPGKYREDRADYYAAIWLTNIGYKRCDAAKKFARYFYINGNNGGPDDEHSSNIDRYYRMCPTGKE